MENDLIPIQNLSYEIRGHKVMLDKDLAKLYQVEVRILNQTVKRNIKRFPSDFMFRLNNDEWYTLKSQFVTSSHGGVRKLPLAFTEQGIAMLSGLLNSDIAINVNIQIMRTFIRLRQYALEHKDLSQRIDELENYIMTYAKENNQEIERINQALNYLIDVTKPTQIGFKTD